MGVLVFDDVSGGMVLCSSKQTTSRCSAVVLVSRWALTTATVLASPLLGARAQLAAALDAPPPGSLLAKPPSLLAAASFAVDGRRARPLALWRCPLVARATTQLLDGWTLGDSDGCESEVVRLLLPVFLLLEVLEDGRQEADEAPEDVLRRLARLLGGAPPRGAKVLVESTPFCSQFFLNSLSQGIVSNVLGPQGCLLLTDARTTHGCEGGPIFSYSGAGDSGRQLVGLVACSLMWWRGEWVGFTLGVLLGPVLHHALLSQSPVPVTSNKDSLSLGLDDAIVMVCCGSGWGSGVVVDKSKGTILTCSHVISQVDSCAVTVQWKARKLPARLLHRTRDGVAFDVAVISVGPVAGLRQVELAQGSPVAGEEVLAAGFPIFSEAGLPPTVTRGIVARVEGPGPSFLQTTCCIQSGASGGAVLRPSGQLLAVMVCNIKDHGSGAVYPHVNLAVPSAVLASPLRQFAATAGDTIMTILLEGTQYYISSMNPYQSELNYFLAYQHCRSLGLQLASFQTKDKAETMMQYLQNEGYDKDFWTSGNKLGKNMAIWMSTGQPFNATFSFMRTMDDQHSELNNTAGNGSGRRIRKSSDQGHDLDTGCVALMSPTFQWDLDDCRVPKHYICEQSRCYYYNYASIPVSVTKGINYMQTTPTTLPAPTFLPGFGAHNSSVLDSQQPATTLSTDAPPLPDYSENLAARRFPFPSPSGVVYVTAVGASDDTYASTASDELNAATDKNE